MSKQANPYTVGIFVIGAITLAVAGLLILGSGAYFQQRPSCIMYFEGSVNGLKVGAPVTLRGVQVGQVSDIKLLASRQHLNFRIPVTVEFDEVAIRQIDSVNIPPGEFIDALIAKGLRAQLQAQSIVTGLLFVNLDFFPETPARLVGTDSAIREIPTIPSKLEQLSRTLENLPILELVDGVNKTIAVVNSMLETDAARNLFARLDEALLSVHSAFERADRLLGQADAHLGPAMQNIDRAAAAAARAADHAAATFAETDAILAEDSEFRYESDSALRSLTRALRSARALADYLERNPNALVFGKSDDGEPGHE